MRLRLLTSLLALFLAVGTPLAAASRSHGSHGSRSHGSHGGGSHRSGGAAAHAGRTHGPSSSNHHGGGHAVPRTGYVTGVGRHVETHRGAHYTSRHRSYGDGHGFLGLGHLFSSHDHHLHSLYCYGGGYGARYPYAGVYLDPGRAYGYGYGYAPRAGYRDLDAGAIRFLVRPSVTRVYVDGYYAGVADDFDGPFQRLRLGPGEHEIALELDGYRSRTFTVLVVPHATIKLHYDMGAGGEADFGVDESRFDEEGGDIDSASASFASPVGRLLLNGVPGDASVYVDGRFVGAARELRTMSLAPGVHRLDLARPGLASITRTIDITAGGTREMNLTMAPVR